MARKTNAEIEAEVAAKLQHINEEAEKRVAAMIPGLMAGLIAELTKVRSDLGPAAAPVTAESSITTKSVLEGLAHAMAKASDPGNKRRILAPEVVEERNLARKAMVEAILKYDAMGEVPVYKLIRSVFINDTLIAPQFPNPQTHAMEDQEIDYPNIPNQAMVPVSESAKVVHGHYLRSIGARAGHLLMGFKLEGDNIEPNAIPFGNLDAPIVLTGKGEVRRGHPGAPRGAEVSISESLAPPDPRRNNVGAKPRVQAVLGTIHTPAVVS